MAMLGIVNGAAPSLYAQRPAQLPHLDDAFAISKQAPKHEDAPAGVFDFSQHDFPRLALTETRKLGAGKRYRLMHFIAVPGCCSHLLDDHKKANPNDEQFTVGFHRTTRASQAFTQDPALQHSGMAFTGLGPTTWGTKQNPNFYVKHFLYGEATQLTAPLTVEGDTATVSSGGVIPSKRYVIIYSGGIDEFLNPEFCYVDAKVNGNELKLRDNGSEVGRGFNTPARWHASGDWVRTVIIGAGNGNARNFAFAYNDDPNLKDGAGRTPWEAQALFDKNNYKRNKYGVLLPTYEPEVIFRDVDLHYIPPNRKADSNLDGIVDHGWSGHTNLFAQSVTLFNQKIAEYFPTKHHVSGSDHSSRPHEFAGFQSENGYSEGGQFAHVPSWKGVDGLTANFDMWQHYTGANKGVPLNIILSKRRDELYPEDYTNITGGYRQNRFIMCMSWIQGGWFGRMNWGFGNKDQHLMLYPEFFVYTGQSGITGYEYGDCVFPYRNIDHDNDQLPSDAYVNNALLAKGYLGQPLWPRIRIYDHSEWEISDAIKNITFPNNISGWTKSGCNISHNTAENALRFDSWTAGAKTNYGDARITGPTVSVVKDQYYTMVMEVKCLAPINTRSIKMGLVGEDIQAFPVAKNWHLITNTFKATSTGNKKIRLEVGKFTEKFLVKSVRVWNGSNRVFRRDFEKGIVLANNGPQTTVLLGGWYQMLRLRSESSHYDPEGRLTTGGLVDRVTLKEYDGVVLLNPETPSTSDADYEETFNDGLAQSWTTSNFNLTSNQLRQDTTASPWSFATTTNLGLKVDDSYSVAVDARSLGTRDNAYDSPILVLKYSGPHNWAYIFINHDNSGGPRTLIFKSKNGAGSTPDSHALPLTSGSKLQTLDVSNWHNMKAKIRGTSIEVRINNFLEVDGAIEPVLNDPGFDGSTVVGVRSPTTSAGVIFDNFRFWDEQSVNSAPELNAIANQTVNENSSIDVSLSATDPDGNNTLALTASGLPSFGSLTDNGDGTGSIQFSPWYYGSGTYNIAVTASDGSLSDTKQFTLTVNDVNRAPELDAIANQTVNENSSIDVSLSATDPDGNNTLALTASGLPSFGSLTDNGDGTGSIQFSPWYYGSGTYNIAVTASDGSLSDTKQFTLTVNNVNRAPDLDPLSNALVDENSTVQVNLTASDPDGDSVSFGATEMPAFGALIDNGDGAGVITFSPDYTQAGVYSVTLTVSDGFLDASQSFTVTVNNVNRQPSIVSISDLEVEEGCNHAFIVTASDLDADDILTLTATGLPGFGSLTDNGDGTGLLVVDPTEGDAGEYTLTLTVDDGNSANSTATTSFKLTVTEAAGSGIIYTNDFSSGNVADDFSGATEDFGIENGELVSINSDEYKAVYVKGSIFPRSTDKFKIVSRMKKGTGGEYRGASLRFRDIDSRNWYELQIRESEEGDVRVYGKNGGISTTIGEWDTDLNPTEWNTFSLVLDGADLNVYLGNNLIGTGVLAHHTGYVGLRQRSNDAWWDYYRVSEIGAPGYVEDFDDDLAQNWSNTTDFNTVDLNGNIGLKQVSGAWKFSTYNATVSVDANYSFSVDGRVVGTRTKSYESPTIMVKYKDTDNWILLYINQRIGTAERSIKLKKKIAGNVVVPEPTIVSNITSLSGVDVWNNLEVQVSGDKLNVWVNGVQEVADYTEIDLSNSVFDATSSCGVRSTTPDVSLEYDNFLFYDEYDQ